MRYFLEESDICAVFLQYIRKCIVLHEGDSQSRRKISKNSCNRSRPRANRRGVWVVWSGAARNSGVSSEFSATCIGQIQSLSDTSRLKSLSCMKAKWF